MDNFTKDTLICMVEDLTNMINILKKNNVQQSVLEENLKLKEEIDKLNLRIGQLKSYNEKDTSKWKEKTEELISKLGSSKKEIEALKDEISVNYKVNIASSERATYWEHQFIEKQEENQNLKREIKVLKSKKETQASNNISEKEKINMLEFLNENYVWTKQPKSEYSYEGIQYNVAPSSTKDIHKRMVKWAKEKGIPNIGKQRGIPTEETFKKYIVQKHKERYPEDRWETSEVNEYPKYYNGSNKTPRVNLKIK